MPTRFIQKSSKPIGQGVTSLNQPNVAEIGVDTSGAVPVVKYNADGTVRELALAVTKSEIVTATNVIAASETGTLYFLNSATEFVSTLPAPAIGLNFRFVVTAAPSGASYTIVTTSSSNIIKGQVYTVDVNSATDPGFTTSGVDTISFVDGKSVAGDRVDVICDGTNWIAYGFCSVFDAITFTTVS